MSDIAGASRGFSRAQWGEVASKKGEVRFNADTGQLYTSHRSLAGRFVGAVRDRFRSDTERAARHDAKAQARGAAITELKSFLGVHADSLLKDGPGNYLSTTRLQAVLTKADSYSFESRLNDGEANVHPRAMRYLEARIAKNPTKTLDKELDQLSKLEKNTVAQRCGKTAQRWNALFGQDASAADGRAVKLAMEVKTLANATAVGKINNGRAQGPLAQMTFQAHAGALKGKVQGDAEFRLARELASNTVLTDLAAGRMRVEDSVLAIRIMAQKTDRTPSEILGLMKQQLDCEIGSFTREEIDIGFLNKDDDVNSEIKVGGTFKFDEVFLAGDLNKKLFEKIVSPWSNYENRRIDYGTEMRDMVKTLDGLVEAWGRDADLSTEPSQDADLSPRSLIDPERPGTISGARDGSVELQTMMKKFKLSEEIASLPQRDGGDGGLDLDELRKIKRLHAPAQGAVTRPDAEGARGITQRQYQFLRQVRAEAAGYTKGSGEVVKPSSEREMAVKGQTVTPKGAVLAAMSDRYGLDDREAKVLLSKVTEWFSNAPMTISFKPHEVLIDDPATGKAQMKHGSLYKEAVDLATRTFTPAEMQEMIGGDASVGGLAAPSNLEYADRGINYLPWRVEKNDLEFGLAGLNHREQPKYGAVNINFGKTGGYEGSLYYGAAHAVLKPEVRDRVLFNFNKTREMRADVTTLLHDTMLNRNTGVDLPIWAFMDAMVHNALGLEGIVPTKDLQVEAVIFGDVDFVKDVEKIKIPSPDSTATKENQLKIGDTLIQPEDARRVRSFYAQQEGGPTVTEYKMDDMNKLERIKPDDLKEMVQKKMKELTV